MFNLQTYRIQHIFTLKLIYIYIDIDIWYIYSTHFIEREMLSLECLLCLIQTSQVVYTYIIICNTVSKHLPCVATLYLRTMTAWSFLPQEGCLHTSSHAATTRWTPRKTKQTPVKLRRLLLPRSLLDVASHWVVKKDYHITESHQWIKKQDRLIQYLKISVLVSVTKETSRNLIAKLNRLLHLLIPLPNLGCFKQGFPCWMSWVVSLFVPTVALLKHDWNPFFCVNSSGILLGIVVIWWWWVISMVFFQECMWKGTTLPKRS